MGETDAEKAEREKYERSSLGRHAHLIPPFGSQEFWNIVEIGGASIGAAVVFLRNVLGIIKDARDLKNNLSMTVSVNGETITVADLDQLQALIDKLVRDNSPQE